MAVTNEFSTWLNLKLQEINTDESVFGTYITGILEGDESKEEKREALESILSEILTDNIQDVVQNILTKWSECNEKIAEPSKLGVNLKVEDQLAKLLERTHVQSATKERQYTEEEKKIREHILAQYSQTEISEDEFEAAQSDGDTDKHSSGINKPCGIERNTNFSDVVALQKEKREQARLESSAKKQKDKEDREKQKQLREQKKEKRKTTKAERRR